VSPKACADRHGSQKGRPAVQSGPRRPMTLGNMRARIRTRTIASPRSNPKLARSRCSPSEAKSGDQRGALRVIDPGLPRPFRTPAIHTVAPAGARHSPGKEPWTQLLPIPLPPLPGSTSITTVKLQVLKVALVASAQYLMFSSRDRSGTYSRPHGRASLDDVVLIGAGRPFWLP
jgi:hypothetical protein